VKNLNKILFLLTLICLCFVRCEKEKQSANITLYDKPLPVIQYYITGKWKLEYAYGGLCAGKYIDIYNSYMILSPDHIIAGNDSFGAVVNTNIVWVRAKTLYNFSTYLLNYSSSEYKIVYQIKNDTLVILDNADDGYSYFYTKY
jgi:hypothetical protein